MLEGLTCESWTRWACAGGARMPRAVRASRQAELALDVIRGDRMSLASPTGDQVVDFDTQPRLDPGLDSPPLWLFS